MELEEIPHVDSDPWMQLSLKVISSAYKVNGPIGTEIIYKGQRPTCPKPVVVPIIRVSKMIKSIQAVQRLDSSGNPTVQVDLTTEKGSSTYQASRLYVSNSGQARFVLQFPPVRPRVPTRQWSSEIPSPICTVGEVFYKPSQMSKISSPRA